MHKKQTIKRLRYSQNIEMKYIQENEYKSLDYIQKKEYTCIIERG